MKLAYADPPYPGQSKRHYGEHPDYAGEVDSGDLFLDLADFDGWVLHTSATALQEVLDAAADTGTSGFRIMAWVKPFCAFKRNVSVAYSWEPVLVKAARKPVVSGRIVMRDHISQSITLKRGLVGVKPAEVCRWAFEMMGAQPSDTLFDLFPGTGAVTDAWLEWQAEVSD